MIAGPLSSEGGVVVQRYPSMAWSSVCTLLAEVHQKCMFMTKLKGLSEDPGPHAVFFPGCEGLEGGWDYPGWSSASAAASTSIPKHKSNNPKHKSNNPKHKSNNPKQQSSNPTHTRNNPKHIRNNPKHIRNNQKQFCSFWMCCIFLIFA